MRSCERCGTELPPRVAGKAGRARKYCDACRDERRREIRNATRPTPPPSSPKPCKRCGVELPPRPAGKRGGNPLYCANCREERRREVRDATRPAPSRVRPTLTERTCVQCSVAFMPDRRSQRFCSTKCRFDAAYAAKKADGRLDLQAKRQREAYVPRSPRQLTCVTCGAEFTQVGRGRPRRYCQNCEGRARKCVPMSSASSS